MPFATFHREADTGRRLVDRMNTRPLEYVKKEIVGPLSLSGTAVSANLASG
jgi:hypothetical protein